MDKIVWLQHHWIILLIGAIAADNVLVAFCQGAGLTTAGTILARLGQGLKAALDAIMRNKNVPPAPPMTGTGIATCIALCLLCAPAHAQTVPDVNTLLQKAGAKTGAIYIPNTNQWVATNNITLASYKMVDLGAGVARTDGADVTLSTDISKWNLPISNVPIVSLLNYCNVGGGAVKESGVKKVGYGIYTSISWKFGPQTGN